MSSRLSYVENVMKPLMIYDGECDLCCRWARRWQQETAGKINFSPYQEVANQYPDIPKQSFEKSIQLIEGSRLYRGAHAIFRCMASVPKHGWPLWMYQNIPGFAPMSEVGYRLIASNRGFFSKFTAATNPKYKQK